MDSHGKFSSFLQRLEGSAGRGQGYNRFSYVVDAKATTRSQQGQWQFTIGQSELDRVSFRLPLQEVRLTCYDDSSADTR